MTSAPPRISMIDRDFRLFASFTSTLFAAPFQNSQRDIFSSSSEMAAELKKTPEESYPNILFVDASTEDFSKLKEPLSLFSKAKNVPHVVFVSFTEDAPELGADLKNKTIESGLLPEDKTYSLDFTNDAETDGSRLATLVVSHADNGRVEPKGDLERFLNATMPSLSAWAAVHMAAKLDKTLHSGKHGVGLCLNENACESAPIALFTHGIGTARHGTIAHSVGDANALMATSNDGIVLVTEKITPEIRTLLFASSIVGVMAKRIDETLEHLAEAGNGRTRTLLINPTDEDWTKLKDLKTGTAVTLARSKGSCAVYPGTLPLKLAAESNAYFESVERLYKEAVKENDPALAIKANVASLEQAAEAVATPTYAGIGLVRTEQFAKDDAQSHEALRQILVASGSNATTALETLGNRHVRQMTDLFSVLKKGRNEADPYPVRIRLMDIVPKDFGIDGKGDHGSQLALKTPGLYETQLAAIFSAYKNTNAQATGLRLEIMAPTIKTPEELSQIKTKILASAEKQGIDKKAFKIGSMIETVEAVQNAPELSKIADFFSIGSNDLTEGITQIPRADLSKRDRFIDTFYGQIDPFKTLATDVLRAIKTVVGPVRKTRPDIDISLCGVHATDFNSLKQIHDLGLTSVSLTPAEENLALLTDYRLFLLKEHESDFTPQSASHQKQGTPPRQKTLNP